MSRDGPPSGQNTLHTSAGVFLGLGFEEVVVEWVVRLGFVLRRVREIGGFFDWVY